MTKRRETVFVRSCLRAGPLEVDARVHAAPLARRAVHPQAHRVGAPAVRPARAAADEEDDPLHARRRAPGALADLQAHAQQAAGRRAADAGGERDAAVRDGRGGRRGRFRCGGCRRRRSGRDERQVREAGPARSDRLALARDPAAGAVAAVQQQRALGRAGEDVGLAVAAEVAAGGERGEAGPAAADLLGAPRHPAARAVAAVHQQRAGGGDGEDVGLAVAAEVAAGDDRAEALPAAADLLGLAGEPAAVAVTPVHEQRAGAVAREDVGTAVAAEIAGREQRGEALPAGPDGLAEAGRPGARPVAAVHQQLPARVAHQQVGLAVAAEVAGRHQRVERRPAAASDRLRDPRHPAPRAVAGVEQEPSVGVDGEHVAGPVPVPVGVGG